MINVRVVDAWMRISSKRLEMEIADVQRSRFDFAEELRASSSLQSDDLR